MNFSNFNIPNSLVMGVGIIVLFLVWQFISTWTGEWTKKLFKKEQTGRRKNDDLEWFNKFIDHHDMLTKEIHEFTSVLTRVVQSMADTNKSLSEHIGAVADRDQIMMNDLKKIRNLTEGRK